MNVNKIHCMQLFKLIKAHFERKNAGEVKELSLSYRGPTSRYLQLPYCKSSSGTSNAHPHTQTVVNISKNKINLLKKGAHL